MSMSVGGSGGDDKINSEINTTPLVDVMLVLLIIFLITLPAAIKVAPVTMPRVNNIATVTKPENIIIGIDSSGGLYWNATLLPNGKQELLDRIVARMRKVKTLKDLPEVHIRADKDAQYQYIGGVINIAQLGGVPRVGFISDQDRTTLQ
jgi:biopolymer transport protein ExbD